MVYFSLATKWEENIQWVLTTHRFRSLTKKKVQYFVTKLYTHNNQILKWLILLFRNFRHFYAFFILRIKVVPGLIQGIVFVSGADLKKLFR